MNLQTHNSPDTSHNQPLNTWTLMPLMWIKLQMNLKAGQYGSNDLKPMQERLRPDNMLDNAAATSDRASYSDYECVNIHQQPNN